MTDPVTNSLALQTQFGDDELKKEVNDYIVKIALEVAHEVVREAFNNPDNFRRLIVNNTYEFETLVAQALKNYLKNPRNTV